MNLATKTEKIIDGNLYRATMTLHGDFNKKSMEYLSSGMNKYHKELAVGAGTALAFIPGI